MKTNNILTIFFIFSVLLDRCFRGGGIVLRMGLDNLVPYHCHKYTHKWADDVEKAIWRVDQSRDGEDGRLGHATAAPWEQWRGDC